MKRGSWPEYANWSGESSYLERRKQLYLSLWLPAQSYIDILLTNRSASSECSLENKLGLAFNKTENDYDTDRLDSEQIIEIADISISPIVGIINIDIVSISKRRHRSDYTGDDFDFAPRI